ncbi:MAG TPA: metallophosphoesterase family protein [Thermoleophilaceae bacterium]|nr:metallophosphoesterase family protein [Thermoleophilaceae bacterium]
MAAPAATAVATRATGRRQRGRAIPPDSIGDPLKIAVLSDVHGNLPALRAVLEDVDAAGPDRVWCLGDLVGYGAHPDGCVQTARERCDVNLAGNHDLGVLDHIDIADFAPHAEQAARWTRENASEETLRYLETLSPRHDGEQIGLFHASPRDPIWEYVLSGTQAAECMDFMEPRVSAIGHTHVASYFSRTDGAMAGGTAAAGTELNIDAGEWLLNPGSVGQPRDGDPRAAWLLLDVEQWTATWRRTEYPVDEAAQAINAAGLPTGLGERLYLGQ